MACAALHLTKTFTPQVGVEGVEGVHMAEVAGERAAHWPQPSNAK